MSCRVFSGLLLALSLLVALGCSSASTPAKPDAAPKPEASSKEEGHSHGEGPHGGTVADWGGGKYHVEFTVDHDKKEATVYILGGDGKTPAPIKAEKISLVIADPPIETDLVAQPLEGEADGASSRFVGQHENLGKVQEYEGTITGEVDGTPYSGDFKEVADGHGHKH